MDKELAAANKELERISRIIRKAILDGTQSVRDIGSGLITIWERDLWQLGEEKEKEFFVCAYEAFGLERRSVKAAMAAEHTFLHIEEAALQLPENAAQAVELAKLDNDKQIEVWRRVTEECETSQLPVTVLRVRDAVNQERASEKEEGRGIEIDLDDDDELSLTEKGEEALARIKALCGKKVADALRQKRVKISEDGIKLWADQDDDVVKELPHYVINHNWTVRKSLNYMSKVIDGDTEVDELILMARNRGGRLVGNHQDARIVVEIVT